MLRPDRDRSFDFLAPMMAPVLSPARSNEEGLALARDLLAYRRTRVLILSFLEWAGFFGGFAASMYLALWACGMPLHAGEPLSESYPASFFYGEHELWGRYWALFTIAMVSLALIRLLGWTIRAALLKRWSKALQEQLARENPSPSGLPPARTALPE